MERREPLRSDPAKVRAWQQRTRRRLSAKSDRRRQLDAQTADLRAGVARLPCLLRHHSPCAGPGTPHHLAKSSAGGPTTPDNLVPLCAFHNGWVEDHPAEARDLGLVVRAGIDHAEALRRRIAAGIDGV